MLLSKTCIYGIRSVLFLAVKNDPKFTSIKEIAQTLDIPFHFLTKILQTLSHANIVESVKGPRGGVTLKKASKDISVFDIVTALDGEELFRDCVIGLPGCSDENPCFLHKAWHKTKIKLKVDLEADSLKDLAAKIRKGKLRLLEINQN
jgi:Rrf2 family protein